MSTLYLHIGTPKTGTTAIQCFLADNRKLLREKGYSYPNFSPQFGTISRKRNARFLIDAVLAKEDVSTEEYQKKINKCYEGLYKALEKYENVILTEESIWHACKKIDNFWEDLHEKITSRGHKLKVIVYLRRQDEFIQSYWKFKVLERETSDFMDYVNGNEYKYFPLNYNSHLNWIAERLGGWRIL